MFLLWMVAIRRKARNLIELSKLFGGGMIMFSALYTYAAICRAVGKPAEYTYPWESDGWNERGAHSIDPPRTGLIAIVIAFVSIAVFCSAITLVIHAVAFMYPHDIYYLRYAIN